MSGGCSKRFCHRQTQRYCYDEAGEGGVNENAPCNADWAGIDHFSVDR